MASWLLKAAAVLVLSRVPGGERAAAFARKHVTRSLKLPRNVALAKCRRAARHVQCFLDANGLESVPSDFVALELGTGWFPAAPVAAALIGAERVYTVDVSSHLRWEQLEVTLQIVRGFADKSEFPLVRPDRMPLIEDALRTRDVQRALEIIGVERIVGDARTLSPGRPVDLFFSNNTLEHIPESDLRSIFERFREVGSRRAVMSHWIDMSDHYGGFDSKIGPYNFLQYSEAAFSWVNGPLHYQNRLRYSDFLRLHEQTGWHITRDEPVRGEPSQLRNLKLAPEFGRYAEDDLLVYETWLSSAKTPIVVAKSRDANGHDTSHDRAHARDVKDMPSVPPSS